MASLTRRLTSAVLATTLIASVVAEPAFAQVTPGAPTNGPAGGTASTTAPSNSAGTPSGGTGIISTTRVGPATVAPRTPVVTPAPDAAAPVSTTPPRRRFLPRIRRPLRSPGGTGGGSSAGLNGSNAPSH